VELRHLRYFVAVAEEQHVTRAAEQLHMAQQPLSAAIKNLESELGFDLFDRVANRIHLTAAGGAFLEEARNVLAAADRAVERGRRAARGEVGMFRVGYCSAAMSNVLPSAIASFRELYPSLALDLRRLDQGDQLAALERDELDLAFIHRPFDDRGLQSLDVLDEALYVAIRDTHLLGAYDRIEAAQLAAVPQVRFAAGSADALRVAADTLFERANVVPPRHEEVNDIDTGVGLVAAGLGACIVSEHVARTHRRPGVAFVPLRTDLRLVMAAVWNVRADENTIRRRFLELVTATHDTLLVS
jgi:LysR family transcriptional regulator, benzoate and cis,cis-muconate-responsive activator of ben and cat genes